MLGRESFNQRVHLLRRFQISHSAILAYHSRGENEKAYNTFIFQFQSAAKRKRVLTGGPWLFDRALLILTEPQGTGELSKLNFSRAPFWVQIHNIPIVCMTVETGEILGKRIGKVLEVDSGSTGTCLSNCTQVRILMDVSVTKPLKRGIRAKLGGCNEVMQFAIFYERLLDFCFKCGYIYRTSLSRMSYPSY